jgi:hypothetical protein
MRRPKAELAAGRPAQRFVLRRFLDFFGETLRGATVFRTEKSSSFAPAFNFSRSQTGCAPRPAHVLPDLSRYLIGTFLPFSDPRLPLFLLAISPPNLESCSCNRSALWLRTFPTSSRSFKAHRLTLKQYLSLPFPPPGKGQYNGTRQMGTGGWTVLPVLIFGFGTSAT